MAKIYGIDTNDTVTPEMVRGAIVRCFMEAHGPELEKALKAEGVPPEKMEARKQIEVETLLRVFFEGVKGSFEIPTKKSLADVVGKLKDFSKQYRDMETIEKHASEIMQLINRL